MKRRIEILCPVVPLPQPRQRHAVRGKGRNARAMSYLPDEHPIHTYKARIRCAIGKVWRGRPVLTVPVEVEIAFIYPRTKSESRLPAGGRVAKRVGDGDNLEKAIWDSMTGLIIKDDSQIWRWEGVKLVADPGAKPVVRIVLKW